MRKYLKCFIFGLIFIAGSFRDCLGEEVIEAHFSFPPPVQWKMPGWGLVPELTLTIEKIIFGPASSRSLIKQIETESQSFKSLKATKQHGELYSDRTHVLGLLIHAKSSRVMPETWIPIRDFVVRIKDIDGTKESPLEVSDQGSQRPGPGFIRLKDVNSSYFWVIFPVRSSEKEFLFETGSNPIIKMRVLLKDNKLQLLNLSEDNSSMPEINRELSGVIGNNIKISLKLKVRGSDIEGTDIYSRIGKTLYLKGKRDTMGSFKIYERYPQNNITGIFKGKFSHNFKTMEGYFSKPDGSRLLPFEFHQQPLTSTEEKE